MLYFVLVHLSIYLTATPMRVGSKLTLWYILLTFLVPVICYVVSAFMWYGVSVRVENVRLYPSPRATLTRYIANGLAQAYAAANAVVASMLRDNASQFGLSR